MFSPSTGLGNQNIEAVDPLPGLPSRRSAISRMKIAFLSPSISLSRSNCPQSGAGFQDGPKSNLQRGFERSLAVPMT
jgi:hypothetical protein